MDRLGALKEGGAVEWVKLGLHYSQAQSCRVVSHGNESLDFMIYLFISLIFPFLRGGGDRQDSPHGSPGVGVGCRGGNISITV